jgi:hypothetical protein
LADHSWVIVTMHDVRDYAVRNGLDHIVPFVEAACGAAERHLGMKGVRRQSEQQDAFFADEAVALVLDSLLNATEIEAFPSDNLKTVSRRRRMRPH